MRRRQPCATCGLGMTPTEVRRNLIACDECVRQSFRADAGRANVQQASDDPIDWLVAAAPAIGVDRARRAQEWFDQHPRHRKSSKDDRTRIQMRCTKYGITLGEWASMVADQQSRCAICHKFKSPKMLHIDHDHESGDVRGLLCSGCNTGLGSLGIDGKAAIDRVRAVERYIRTAGKR